MSYQQSHSLHAQWQEAILQIEKLRRNYGPDARMGTASSDINPMSVRLHNEIIYCALTAALDGINERYSSMIRAVSHA